MLDHLAAEAALAAEEILETYYRISVSKAEDPLAPRTFLVLSNRIANALQRSAGSTERDALKEALKVVDVDFTTMSARDRDRVIARATSLMRPVGPTVVPKASAVFEGKGQKLADDTRASARRKFKLEIPADFSTPDRFAIGFLESSQSNFITNEYGRRLDEFGGRARRIVAEGLELGLGPDEIAESLSSSLTAATTGRSKSYWRVIASAFSNRARNFSQLASFSEAGVATYTFEAVLDEVTTDQCRFMHGRTFTVRSGLQRYDETRQAADPEAVKDIQPWLRRGRDDDGNEVLFVKQRSGRRIFVADIEQSARGQADRVGTIRPRIDNKRIALLGIAVPPLHANCRSTITADV